MRTLIHANDWVGPVPPRALVLSLAALSVPVAVALFSPESLDEYGDLLWLLAVLPAFLVAHYRGWERVSVALAGCMAILSLSYVLAILLGRKIEAWPLLLFVIVVYIAIALGFGWFSEVSSAVIERGQAEEQLKVAQLQLIQAEKLEALGRLAAGVAHEVKNPLMIILTGVKYLSKHLQAPDVNVAILLEEMREAVERADSVINGLLDLSALREVDMRAENLNETLEQLHTEGSADGENAHPHG